MLAVSFSTSFKVVLYLYHKLNANQFSITRCSNLSIIYKSSRRQVASIAVYKLPNETGTHRVKHIQYQAQVVGANI